MAVLPLPEHWKRACSSSCSFPFKQLDVSRTAPATTQCPGGRFLTKLFLAQLEDMKSVPVWVFFQSQLCLRGPSNLKACIQFQYRQEQASSINRAPFASKTWNFQGRDAPQWQRAVFYHVAYLLWKYRNAVRMLLKVPSILGLICLLFWVAFYRLPYGCFGLPSLSLSASLVLPLTNLF